MIEQLITSFIASAAFGVIFNAPKESLVKCGFVGMTGWFVYYLLYVQDVSSIVATLVASLIVAVISQFFAKTFKMPIIIFSVAELFRLYQVGYRMTPCAILLKMIITWRFNLQLK